MTASTATAIFATLACLVFESALAQPITPTATNAPAQTVPASFAEDSVVLPTGFNDPIEPFNRSLKRRTGSPPVKRAPSRPWWLFIKR